MYRCRAATIGSVGTANGSLSIITHDNCSPRTSTPCQKLDVANNTAFGVWRKRSNSLPFEALPCRKQGYSISGIARSYSDCIPAKLVDRTNARPSVAFTILMTSAAAAFAQSEERGSGILGGRY